MSKTYKTDRRDIFTSNRRQPRPALRKQGTRKGAVLTAVREAQAAR